MDLAFLSPVIDAPGPWATVWTESTYDTADAATQQELSARGTRDRLEMQGADRATRDALYAALTTASAPGGFGRRTGRYLLGRDGEVVADLALAGPPPRSGEAWSALPRLSPLLGGLAEETPCMVAFIDRTGADLQMRDGGRRVLGTHQAGGHPVRRTGRDVWSERHHRLKVENTWRHNAREIADFIAESWDDSGAEVLLLAGDARERHSVRDQLPDHIAARAAETEHGGRAQGALNHPELLERDVAALRAAHEREATDQALARYRTGDSAGTADIPALVEAAREHRIDTLFIHPRSGSATREVWVGDEPDQVAAQRNELQYLGASEPHAARADDALLRSCAATDAEVVVVPDTDQAPAGGLGALLRWG